MAVRNDFCGILHDDSEIIMSTEDMSTHSIEFNVKMQREKRLLNIKRYQVFSLPKSKRFSEDCL